MPLLFLAAGRFLAADFFFPPLAAFFFFAGFAGFRFGGRFLAGGGAGGGVDPIPAVVDANDVCGASAKSSGGGVLTPSSFMTVRPF